MTTPRRTGEASRRCRNQRGEMRRKRSRGETNRRRTGETTRKRGETTRRRWRGTTQRWGNNEEEHDAEKGGNNATPQHRVTPSSRAGWLSSCLLCL